MVNKLKTKQEVMTLIEGMTNTCELNTLSLRTYLPHAIVNESVDCDFLGYIFIKTVPYFEEDVEYLGVKIPFLKVIKDDCYEQLEMEELSGLTKKEADFLIGELGRHYEETKALFNGNRKIIINRVEKFPICGGEDSMKDELSQFSKELKSFIEKSQEDFGGEKSQVYFKILEGILAGINLDIKQ